MASSVGVQAAGVSVSFLYVCVGVCVCGCGCVRVFFLKSPWGHTLLDPSARRSSSCGLPGHFQAPFPVQSRGGREQRQRLGIQLLLLHTYLSGTRVRVIKSCHVHLAPHHGCKPFAPNAVAPHLEQNLRCDETATRGRDSVKLLFCWNIAFP